MRKRVFMSLVSATMFALSLTVLPSAHATVIPTYTWYFNLPSDAPYQNCTITFHADGYAQSSDKITVNKGSSISWSSQKPLSMIFGYCNGAYFLKGQYCDGIDVTNGSNYTAHSCKYDVRVRFCPKVPNPSQYNSVQYGFCPN